MLGVDAALRRRRFLSCAGGAAAVALGSMVWLGETAGTAEGWVAALEGSVLPGAAGPTDLSAGPGSEQLADESLARGAGAPSIGLDSAARVIAVKSWAPASRAHSLVFVCPDSPLLGRTMHLSRQAGGGRIAGLAVAAPEWTGPCEETGIEPFRAGATLRVVLAPEEYVALIRGHDGWDPGLLQVAFEPPEDVPPPEPREIPAIAAR